MKCRYCGKETAKEYCSFECRKAYLDLFDEEDKAGDSRRPFIIGSILVSIPVIILFGGPGITLLCALIGLTLFTHPFPDRLLKEKTAIKKGVTQIKVLAVLIIAIGIPFAFFYWMPFFL